MSTCMLQTFFTWTYKGVLCTCRFLWICPYNAVKFLPRQKYTTEMKIGQVKRPALVCENKVTAAIPGSPDRVNALYKRVTKTEKEILSLKTRIACERASWEMRFLELQRQQEELRNQLASDAKVLVTAGSCDGEGESGGDNGGVSDESLGGFHKRRRSRASSKSETQLSSPLNSRSTSSISSASSVRSWKLSHGPHRVFVPHSPMDLQLGHRVRIMLPSGRISTGTVRFLGHLQGRQSSTLGWSCRLLMQLSVTAPTTDRSTLNVNLDTVFLCHSTNY